MRNRRLKRVEAVVERQKRMPAEGNDHRLFLDSQNRRSGVLGAGRKIGDGRPLLPLGDRLGIDPVPLRQRPQALLTMLYRSTDCLCRRGAPMKNLAHSASFESLDKIAPSTPGTKHLRCPAAELAVGLRYEHASDRVSRSPIASADGIVCINGWRLHLYS